MSSRSLASALLAVGAIAGCRQDRPADSAATPEPPTPASAPAPIASYTFTATDYQFAGPATLPTGPATLRLVNQGKELHHLSIVRLEQGKTFEDFTAALAAQKPGAPPAWVHSVGGPNAAEPGGEVNATLTLLPGQYVVLCYIPSPDGKPHIAKGMIGKFEVTVADSGSVAVAEPTADAVIKMTDYAFELSGPLKAGKQTIRIENAGPQFHETVLVRFAPGKSLADFGAWAKSGFQGPPPGAFIGGAGPMDTGEHNLITADLAPGEYGLICFLPDAKDHKEHLVHGMMKQVTVS